MMVWMISIERTWSSLICLGRDYHRSQTSESSKSGSVMEARQSLAASSHFVVRDFRVPSQSSSGGFVQPDERDVASKYGFHFDGMKRPRTTRYRHRKKQLVMGQGFLLINRTCLQTSDVGKGFQFFHTPSLSTVVVRVKRVSLVDITIERAT